jgi:hypothetical protein
MIGKRQAWILGGCAVAALVWLAAHRHNPIDEAARIRGTIAAMAAAIEQADCDAFMRHVGATYRDNRGHADRAALERELRAILLRFALRERLVVNIDHCDVELDTSHATARVTALVWTRRAHEPRVALVAPRDAVRYEFQLRFEQIDAAWLVVEVIQLAASRG